MPPILIVGAQVMGDVDKSMGHKGAFHEIAGAKDFMRKEEEESEGGAASNFNFNRPNYSPGDFGR